MHPQFADGGLHDQVHRQTPELFRFPRKRDRATRLLNFIGEVIVNGNPEVKGRPRPTRLVEPEAAEARAAAAARRARSRSSTSSAPSGSPPGCCEQKRVLLTDTTMRDAHQSLLATRFRTHDMAAIAPYYASLVPEPVLGRVLGRRDVRRGDALPQRMSVGAPARVARGDAEPAAADAAALGERGRLHELSRQRRAVLRAIRRRGRASTCSASSTRSTGSRTCASRSTPCASRASCAKRRSATPAISPIRARPSTTSSTT